MSSSATLHVATLRSLLIGLRVGMTAAELMERTGRPRSSLYRDLAAVRELGVVLAPRPRRAGEDPPFRVLDWGPFDPERLDAAGVPTITDHAQDINFPPDHETWNRAIRGAFRRGAAAHREGLKLDQCPYLDHRKPSGKLSWSRAFQNAWRAGWRWAEKGKAWGP